MYCASMGRIRPESLQAWFVLPSAHCQVCTWFELTATPFIKSKHSPKIVHGHKRRNRAPILILTFVFDSEVIIKLKV